MNSHENRGGRGEPDRRHVPRAVTALAIAVTLAGATRVLKRANEIRERYKTAKEVIGGELRQLADIDVPPQRPHARITSTGGGYRPLVFVGEEANTNSSDRLADESSIPQREDVEMDGDLFSGCQTFEDVQAASALLGGIDLLDSAE